jgi:hypothetical protein
MSMMSKTPREKVYQVFRKFLAAEPTRSELLYLVGRAEDGDHMTWVTGLGFHLQDVKPDFSARTEDESSEEYVQRVIKYLISKESEKGMANAVDEVLGDMETLRGEHSIPVALRKALQWA